jgi:hypothetical protein
VGLDPFDLLRVPLIGTVGNPRALWLNPLVGELASQSDYRADSIGDDVDDVECWEFAVGPDERLHPRATIWHARKVMPVRGVLVAAQRCEPPQRVRDIV